MEQILKSGKWLFWLSKKSIHQKNGPLSAQFVADKGFFVSNY